ncbi:hypothetical protein JL722_592 [Aureococcus anophagefferens]|nr:hypothetical protein JL722_592 [Aureococcus anophagefferens]
MAESASAVVAALAAKCAALTSQLDDSALDAQLAAAAGNVAVAGAPPAAAVPKSWASGKEDAIGVALAIFVTAANDLERGSVLGGDGAGAGAPLRALARGAARRLLEALRALAASLAAGDGSQNAKSGVVWEAAGAARQLPASNRAAYRREFLSWATELKDAIAEFGELAAAEAFSYDAIDDGFGGDDDAYGDAERPAAAAVVECLRVLGATYKDVLVAMDAAGKAGDFGFVASVYGAGAALRRSATTLAEELYPPLDPATLGAALDGAAGAMAAVLAVLDALRRRRRCAPPTLRALGREARRGGGARRRAPRGRKQGAFASACPRCPRMIIAGDRIGKIFGKWSHHSCAYAASARSRRPALPPPPPPRSETDAVLEELDAAVSGPGKLIVVNGVAGAGKSRLLRDCYARAGPGSRKVALVFNADAGAELRSAGLEARGRSLGARTAHSLGWELCRALRGGARLTERELGDDDHAAAADAGAPARGGADKTNRILDAFWPVDKLSDGARAKKSLRVAVYGAFVRDAVSFAKQAGAGVAEIVPDDDEDGAWDRVIARHRLGDLLSDWSLDRGGLSAARQKRVKREWPVLASRIAEARRMARRVFAESVRLCEAGRFDFDDMIFAPLLLRGGGAGVFGTFEFVFVDEAQDSSRLRRHLYRKLLAPGGRLLVVGDDNQAINAFAGADHGAIERFVEENSDLAAPRFKLTTCYRCAEAVINLANDHLRKVDDAADPIKMRPRTDAPEGRVERDVTFSSRPLPQEAGDTVVLGRCNRDLVRLLYVLARQGRTCRMRGRTDLAKKLRKLVRACAASGARDLDDFESEATWRAARKQFDFDGEDICEILTVVVDELRAGEPVADVAEAIDAEIAARFESEEKMTDALLSTVHKAKGGGWKRVYILQPECLPHPYLMKTKLDKRQEYNAYYVAITRAKECLYFLKNVPRNARFETGSDDDDDDAAAEPPATTADDLAILGFPPDASPDDAEIRRAYRLAARRVHPDKRTDKEAATAEFRRTASARSRLLGEEDDD